MYAFGLAARNQDFGKENNNQVDQNESLSKKKQVKPNDPIKMRRVRGEMEGGERDDKEESAYLANE